MYQVSEAPAGIRDVINPRRGAVRTIPEMGWKDYLSAKDQLFTQFGLEDYVGCITGEMYSRPVPHVFRTSEIAPVTKLFAEEAPELYARIIPLLKAPIQTFNPDSRVGWPWFDHPDDKKARLMPAFASLEERGARETLDGSFIIMNIRLQPEPKTKVRDMMFIDDNGSVYSKKVDEKARTIEVGDLGELIAARTRLVFNMPYPNLYKQVLDTAIHNVLLSFPAFHHNMYSATGVLPVRGSILALDVKHFERHTAGVVRLRAELLGGLYADIVREFTDAPFLVPSDTRKKAWLIWPDREGGWSDQFASGDSAVAPSQKELFACLLKRFAREGLGVSAVQALDWVLQGGDERVTIRNYGDDNFFSGDPGALKELFSYLEDYLHVEEEDPPRFLGFYWVDGAFRLGKSSYLLKTWLNERKPGPPFREYPWFGWAEKRKIYAQYGTPDIAGAVFGYEDEVLAAHGLPWSLVLRNAAIEAQMLYMRAQAHRQPFWLLEKDYLLTAEEKIATGKYGYLTPGETGPMMARLLGSSWRSKLS